MESVLTIGPNKAPLQPIRYLLYKHFIQITDLFQFVKDDILILFLDISLMHFAIPQLKINTIKTKHFNNTSVQNGAKGQEGIPQNVVCKM